MWGVPSNYSRRGKLIISQFYTFCFLFSSVSLGRHDYYHSRRNHNLRSSYLALICRCLSLSSLPLFSSSTFFSRFFVVLLQSLSEPHISMMMQMMMVIMLMMMIMIMVMMVVTMIRWLIYWFRASHHQPVHRILLSFVASIF